MTNTECVWHVNVEWSSLLQSPSKALDDPEAEAPKQSHVIMHTLPPSARIGCQPKVQRQETPEWVSSTFKTGQKPELP